jgi:hypothetical protein
MRFDSKEHMIRELLTGKRFIGDYPAVVIHYDPTHKNPFRAGNLVMNDIWDKFDKDIWEEFVPKNVHQDLIATYRKDQEWQYQRPESSIWFNCQDHDGKYCEPEWHNDHRYRIRPEIRQT